jgi:hypothetical protein
MERNIHFRSLVISAKITRSWHKRAIVPLDVIRVLHAASVRFVLIGTQALGGWMRKPRAAPDVEVVISARRMKRATESLSRRFPRLKSEVGTSRTTLYWADEKRGKIRVNDPTGPLFDAFFPDLAHTRCVRTGTLEWRIPSLPMDLAITFRSMTSPDRSLDMKYLDAHDFLYLAKSGAGTDFDELDYLARRMKSKGPNGLTEIVRRASEGKKVDLVSLF